MNAPELSIVVPAFNEAAIIASTLEQLAAAARAAGVSTELLLADDGSMDGTAQAAAAAQLDDMPLRVLPATRNAGKGDAVRRGVLAARGRYVLFTDADLSTPLSELERFLEQLRQGRPVVIGSRKLEPQRVARRQPWPRQFLGRGFSWLARRLLHPQVTDFTCGFKAFHRQVVPTLFTDLSISGWAFDAELMRIAWRRRVPVLELPVSWSNRRETRVRLGRDILASARDLVRIVLRDWRGAYRPRESQST